MDYLEYLRNDLMHRLDKAAEDVEEELSERNAATVGSDERQMAQAMLLSAKGYYNGLREALGELESVQRGAAGDGVFGWGRGKSFVQTAEKEEREYAKRVFPVELDDDVAARNAAMVLRRYCHHRFAASEGGKKGCMGCALYNSGCRVRAGDAPMDWEVEEW